MKPSRDTQRPPVKTRMKKTEREKEEKRKRELETKGNKATGLVWAGSPIAGDAKANCRYGFTLDPHVGQVEPT
eukprot:1320588-Amorphochlora_amoeboformis.AAC.1